VIGAVVFKNDYFFSLRKKEVFGVGEPLNFLDSDRSVLSPKIGDGNGCVAVLQLKEGTRRSLTRKKISFDDLID